MTTTDSALAVRDIADLAPTFVVSLDDLKRQLAQLEQFKREIMVKGTDYGEIPGADKPTLLKPGAEKLTLAFGLAPVPTTTSKVEDWETGLFHYEVRCDLISKRTGEVVASAHGSANTREPRYRWRKAERQCPECGKPAVIKGKADYGGGWLCWTKRDGCGAKFRDDDARITQQVVGNIANPEPFELVNTVLKMAEKRALVAATLIATGGSGTWTQDVEDLPSLAGDAVIEAEYTPLRERDVQDAPQRATKPSADTVTSDDDRLWKRWLSLRDEALGLGVRDVAETALPIARTLLTSLGLRLAAEIEARKTELATEDAARAAGKAAHEDSATGRSPVTPEGRGEESPPSSPRRPRREDLWQENKALSDRASDLKLTTRTVPQRATDEEIAAENERLSALIRAHEAGSTASPEPEQAAAF